jgi:hypothetical protein
MALQQADYVLGHTSVEQQRLIRQARVLAPLTERFLQDAGISSGMRVLDIGCGMGDVTIIAAHLSDPPAKSHPLISIRLQLKRHKDALLLWASKTHLSIAPTLLHTSPPVRSTRLLGGSSFSLFLIR